MIRIGIVGIGFMGVTHFKAMQKVRRGKVVAVCTRDRRKLGGDWRSVQGNFGGHGGVQNLESVAQYREVDALLADPNVDLVDICLPTPMHADVCVAALRAGKDVLVEKPISLSPRQADRMLKTARKEKRLLMVAHVLRFFPEFRLIKEALEGREYGKIQAMHIKRIISKPNWRDPKENGGPAIDLHIHDVDFLQHLLGMPAAVTSTGYLDRGGLVEYVHTHYHYAGKRIAVSAESGWLSQAGCPFEHGYDVYFEGATLKFNSSSGKPPQLLTKDGKARRPRLNSRDGFVAELQEAVDSVQNRKPSRVIGGQSARNSIAICLKEIESAQKGRKISIGK
jgi:predicted dehydrogenase